MDPGESARKTTSWTSSAETRDDDGAEVSTVREELDKDRAAEQGKVHVQLDRAVR